MHGRPPASDGVIGSGCGHDALARTDSGLHITVVGILSTVTVCTYCVRTAPAYAITHARGAGFRPETGKAADLIVLDRNLFQARVNNLHKTHVLLTLLDGKPIYRDPHFAWH